MRENRSLEKRIRVDGRFFRAGRNKFHLRGVAYGPFAPNSKGEPVGEKNEVLHDFSLIRELGANLLRVYFVPPKWFMDLAAEHELRLFIDVPWNQTVCFLDRPELIRQSIEAVRKAAVECGHHPAVFALSVANEFPPDIVRWSGATAVADHIDRLVREVKEVAPQCLCTFGNFPTTEFLVPNEVDFVCFNVYLHDGAAFDNYLARLHMLADVKPLVIGEVGVDSLREGQQRQADILKNLTRLAFARATAGVVVFRFTDSWHKDGQSVEDWEFGLTTRDRRPKPAFFAVQEVFRAAPYFIHHRQPKVSVIVAAYNAAKTLPACLDSLAQLNYPDYEVILVDDGSTDATADIAAQHPNVRYIKHPTNLGLSVARNTGIAAATGEIVAFTDADCRVDEDWLHYLVGTLVEGAYAGVGGHNLLPPDDSAVAAVVQASPGVPTHVMLTDKIAEHIPGCNMAFWRSALIEVGCFDPIFQRAGDDVDICWRLQQHGFQLGFSPGAFVWHYRRSTVSDYLRQQRGYGEAEALLDHKHPEKFGPFGHSIWRGQIYGARKVGITTRHPVIYRGRYGAALFQRLYPAPYSLAVMLLTSIEYHAFVTVPLLLLSLIFTWAVPLALVSVALSAGVCIAAGAQAQIPRAKKRFWSRPLVALLFALHPIVRGWARYRGRLLLRRTKLGDLETLESISRKQQHRIPRELAYIAPPGFLRQEFLDAILCRLGREGFAARTDTGWGDFDIEVYGGPWSRLHLVTASEYWPGGGQSIRCRLRPRTTLAANVAGFFICALMVVLVALAAKGHNWLWLSLVLMPVFVLWVWREQRDLQRLTGVLVDDVAKRLGLQAEHGNTSAKV